MLHVRTTAKSVDEAARDLATATPEHGFGVLHEHDLQATMKEKGVDFPHACRILEVCNPRHAAGVLGEDMRVSLALPCRISVWSEDGETRVGTLLPTAMLEIFAGGPAMNEVARQVEETMLAIMDDAL